MYLIELNESELDEAISDSEYFTASDDEYFSADDFRSEISLPARSGYSLPPRISHSARSGSQHSSAASSSSKNKNPSALSNMSAKITWTVDDSEQRHKYQFNKHTPVDASGMRNYYLWRRIITSGKHPRDAANIIGSQFCFKQLRQKKNIQIFSLRLNDQHRVCFMIQEKERVVKVLNIGSHAYF